MLNLIVHGRHLAIDVAGILTALYAHQRRLKDCSPVTDNPHLSHPRFRNAAFPV